MGQHLVNRGGYGSQMHSHQPLMQQQDVRVQAVHSHGSISELGYFFPTCQTETGGAPAVAEQPGSSSEGLVSRNS